MISKIYMVTKLVLNNFMKSDPNFIIKISLEIASVLQSDTRFFSRKHFCPQISACVRYTTCLQYVRRMLTLIGLLPSLRILISVFLIISQFKFF